jgi:processive 1,2-diacylglycerol beta-glucosyltransferase
MVKLYNKENNAFLGEITEEQLQFLIDQLEEESSDDQDYYLNAETIDMFEQSGADYALIGLLRKAIGTREDVEIRWSKD